METIFIKLITTGALLVISILSGIWLHKKGRPLNTAIFTLHKLVAVAAIVLVVISAVNLFSRAEIRSLVDTAILALSGIIFLALVISGMLLSFDKLSIERIRGIHKITPLLALISSAGVVFLLSSN